MKIKEELGMFFGGMLDYIYGLLYIGSAMFILMPFLSLYNTFKEKGTIEKYDFSMLLIEIPAIATLIIIRGLMKKRKSGEPMKIDTKN